MKMAKGVIPPMVTPFKKDGSLDEKNLIRLVHFLSERVNGLFIGGSYGNGPLMTIKERKRVVEIVAEHIGEKIQFIVHVGSTNVRDSLNLAQHAERVGVEKVASVLPYYYHHNEESILLFFKRLVEGVSIPVYVYNNPKYTGVAIDTAMLKRLADIGVAGVKDSSFDIMVLADYISKVKNDSFDVVLGTEAMFLPGHVLGVNAFIPGLGNAFPELCVDLYDAAVKNDLQKARELQYRVNSVRDVMYLFRSTVVAIYNMLRIRGVCEAYPREPFTELTRDEYSLLQTKLKELEVLEE